MQITVVVPTFNEAENLPKLVSALFNLPRVDLKVLVVDDNSPDGTGKLADRLTGEYPGRFSVLHRPGKQGLGAAYRAGFAQALQDGAEAVCEMDADFSHPPEKIPEMADRLEQGYDIVFGSRYIPGGGLDQHWSLWRKGLSIFGNWYARTILGLGLQDVTGGFRLFRRSALISLPLAEIQSTGYMFQIEVAYVASLMGYRFNEVPFYFAERRWGKSKMSLRIQAEAAIRTWQLKGLYKNLAIKKA